MMRRRIYKWVVFPLLVISVLTLEAALGYAIVDNVNHWTAGGYCALIGGALFINALILWGALLDW